MAEFNPHKPDNYAVHLANMTNAGGVVASEDIYNDQGTLLIKKGNVIKDSSARLLLNHKLVQPLETSVSISDAITGKQLYDNVVLMLRADKESWSIHNAMHLDDSLDKYCARAMSYPLIAQKMTVLMYRLKLEYDKALYCAWFSMALAAQMSASGDFIEEAFLAGLVHDTGLLHIDSAIVEKTGAYTPEEWRAVQSHTLIADTFLSYIGKLPLNVRRAVREHHERCDGSGYPAALFTDKLSVTGQIVGMADTVWAICKKPTGRKGMSLADVITITRMNKGQHPNNVESALYRVTQKAARSGQVPVHAPVSPQFKTELGEKGRKMQAGYVAISPLLHTLQPSDTDRVVRSAFVRFNRLRQVFNGSGLLTQEILEWLSSHQSEETEAISYDLYELSLMYSEFEWQLFQFSRSLQQVVNHSRQLESGAKSVIECVVKDLESLLTVQHLPSQVDTTANMG